MNLRTRMHALFMNWIAVPIILNHLGTAPDFIIGSRTNPYLRRWWLIPRNRFLNIYLHEIIRSDADRELHDHPWWNVSVILLGRYIERMPMDQRAPGRFDFVVGRLKDVERKEGNVVFRSGKHRHRLLIQDNFSCWSLFITGPKYRTWGFYCRNRFVPWTEFVDPADSGKVGNGCGEQ